MENIYLAWLHHIWLTHKKLHFIFKDKQNYKYVFDNINYNFLKSHFFNDKQIDIVLKRYKNLKLDFLIKKLEQRKVKIINFHSKNYPSELKNIANAPFLFYLRWKIWIEPKIAIVGSRNISSYWEKAIEHIVSPLSKYFSIVSGWAEWCDSKAHIESIKNKCHTICVTGTWIDIDYPTKNKKLFDDIVDSGWAIISIFSIWEPWNPYNFPIRNEIIVWLSQWILVVEAKEKSWSLITANLALDMWKDVFAIPGEIFRHWSIWTNCLIKNSQAKLILSSEDILEEYNISFQKEKKKDKLFFWDKLEKEIYNSILLESLTLDDLSFKLNISISEISFKISILEIKWVLHKNISGKYELS